MCFPWSQTKWNGATGLGRPGSYNPGQPRSQSAARTSSNLDKRVSILDLEWHPILDVPAKIRRRLRLISDETSAEVNLVILVPVLVRVLTCLPGKPIQFGALTLHRFEGRIVVRVRRTILVKLPENSRTALKVRRAERVLITLRAQRLFSDLVRVSRAPKEVRIEHVAFQVNARVQLVRSRVFRVFGLSS